MADYLQYQGKVCVVTGAASGIGKATTETLVDLGAKVYAIDFAPVATPGVAAAIHADLGKKADIDAAFVQIPQSIDAFFGVAGVSGVKHDYDTVMLVNFGANKYVTDTYLAERVVDGGAIAYVTSAGGMNWEKYQDEILPLTRPTTWDGIVAAIEALGMSEQPGAAAYALSKRVVNLYASQEAVAFAPRGIRVNTLQPCSTDTGMTDQFAAMVGGMDNLVAHAGFAKRLSTPDEQALPLVWLNSAMATFVSGQVLTVDLAGRAAQVLGLAPDGLDFPMLPKAAEV